MVPEAFFQETGISVTHHDLEGSEEGDVLSKVRDKEKLCYLWRSVAKDQTPGQEL